MDLLHWTRLEGFVFVFAIFIYFKLDSIKDKIMIGNDRTNEGNDKLDKLIGEIQNLQRAIYHLEQKLTEKEIQG